MAKSRHRKKHKKKVQAFKSKRKEKMDGFNKAFKGQLAKMMEEQKDKEATSE